MPTEISKKKLIINGNNFSTLNTFYREVNDVFTFNLGWKIDYSLDVFDDLLQGGFGVFDHQEAIKLIWIHFSKSKRRLGDKLIAELVEIISAHQHIEFVAED